jgi:hypothetical protein
VEDHCDERAMDHNTNTQGFHPRGWKDFDLLMFAMSIATIMWVLISH